jgi:hypothetical protein
MTIRWASDATRIAEKTAGPLLDVLIRLWLGGIFWASAFLAAGTSNANPAEHNAVM